MSEIIKNPNQFAPVPVPDAEIFLLGHGKVNFEWNFTRKAPFWFLYYNPERGARLDFEGQILRPAERDVLLIPPYTAFRSSCENPFEHLYVHFYAGRPYSQVKPGVMRFDAARYSPLELLLRETNPPSAAAYALLFSVLAEIPADRFASGDTPADDRIPRSLTLLNQGLDNEEICKEIGMSSSNFQRCFKLEMGISPQRYAMQMRLEKARCWLLSVGNDITLIARECGFSDRYAFSKAFKKYFGIPPRKYSMAVSEETPASPAGEKPSGKPTGKHCVR